MSAAESLVKENTRRIILTLSWFTASLLISVFIPNIGVIIHLLGAFSAVFIFIFPGMCLLKTVQNKLESGEKQTKKKHFLKALSIMYIIIGTFIFGLTLTQSILQNLQGAEPDSAKFTCNVITTL
uniref:Amino acid transporter transmembrane domain-containing protein n=1 Tax=Biomphalaria glabrata TaxID=6526 RepID=A0A2C9KLI8_BIOGL